MIPATVPQAIRPPGGDLGSGRGATATLPPTPEGGRAAGLPRGAGARPLPAVPGYEILGELGRGGMGVVYRARDVRLNRPTAIKMLLGGHYADPVAQVRFLIEAEAVARIQHPHVVQVHEFGQHDGQPFFALEFVEGGTLAAKLQLVTRFAPRDAAEVVAKVADGIAAAHAKGIVHRDLKPANVLLDRRGEPKVTDFGLAKVGNSDMTASGAIMGTPSYMSPEQAAGRTREVGTPTDVYALGAILYELLTGRPPFRGETTMETIHQVLTRESERPRAIDPAIPRDLETICMKCLAKEPGGRYATAAEVCADLRAYLDGRPIAARPVGRVERAVKWVRRNPVVTGMAAAVAIALAAGTIVSVAMAVVANERADRIESINKQLGVANEEKSRAAAEAKEQARIAEEQSRLAYKTLESVIFDIQTKLAAVPNAQHVRGDLLRTALKGLEQLSAKLRADNRVDRSAAVATLNLAEVFRQVGNETGSGAPADANRLYDRAVTTFEALLRAAPDDPVAQGDLAEACVLFAINLSRTDDLGANVTQDSVAASKGRPLLIRAGELGRRAIGLRRGLLAADPLNPSARYEVARALSEWAYQEMRSGDAEASRAALAESHGLLKALLAAHPQEPSYRFLFGRTASRLGDYYFDMVKGGHEQSAPYYEESLAVLRRLAAERPKDYETQMEFANAWSRVGDLYAARNQHEQSLGAFRKELEVTQALEKLAPNNAQTMSDSGISYDHVSRELLYLKRYEEALPVLLRVIEIRLDLVAADPDNRRHHAQLLRPFTRLGTVYENLREPQKAIEAYELGLRTLTAFRTRTGDRSLDDHIAVLEAGLKKWRAKSPNAK